MAQSLDDLIKTSQLPVFVDFWAEWCAPCRSVAPVVKQLAQEFSGRLTVVKVNVDKQSDAASRHQVQSIPALMLFHRGELKWRTAGAMSYPQLKAEVMKVLGA
ncbi:MAG: thioredoxin [Chlorobiaceae bacterium]|jgi:thioredoxin 1|nr:thioredoxin [Chlorobiaceae bacterium]